MFHYISVFMFLPCIIFALCFLYNTYYHKLHQATNPRFKSHHQSTQNHNGQQCREPHHGQPQNSHENATYLLRTTPPPTSVASTVAAAPVEAIANASHLDPRQPWLPPPPLSS